MPRGRHRDSPTLHRLLPLLTAAGSATALAVIAWFAPAGGNAVVPRALAVAAALAACVCAVLLRGRDRAAGIRLAELKTARARDEYHYDERVAELESDAEESRDIRQRLKTELSAAHTELARLRGEHADLLRRYATAESERARALRGLRRAAEPPAAPAAAARGAAPAPAALTAAVYAAALEALRELTRNAARQQILRTIEAARVPEGVAPPAGSAPAPRESAESTRSSAASPAGPRPPALPVREHRLVPEVTAAILPYAYPRRPAGRAGGGFDFFGAGKSAAGEEGHDQEDDDRREVIDLTAHDDTEPLDLSGLRTGAPSVATAER